MVMIRRTDAETLAEVLYILSGKGTLHFEILQRLEQAVGRPVRLLDVEK